jgi:hypothetical protein
MEGKHQDGKVIGKDVYNFSLSFFHTHPHMNGVKQIYHNQDFQSYHNSNYMLAFLHYNSNNN